MKNQFISVFVEGVPTKISLNKVIKIQKFHNSDQLQIAYEYGWYTYHVGKGEMDFPAIDGFVSYQNSDKSLMFNLDCVKSFSIKTNAYAVVTFHDNLEIQNENFVLDEEMQAVCNAIVAPSAILSVLPPKV
jgi:hypothetical protein